MLVKASKTGCISAVGAEKGRRPTDCGVTNSRKHEPNNGEKGKKAKKKEKKKKQCQWPVGDWGYE